MQGCLHPFWSSVHLQKIIVLCLQNTFDETLLLLLVFGLIHKVLDEFVRKRFGALGG